MTGRTIRMVSWGGLGDVVLLTPSLRELKSRHPDGRLLVYWVRPEHREVLRNNPRIDGLYPASIRGAPFSVLAFRLGWISALLADYGNYQPSYLYDAPHARSAADVIAEMLGLALRDSRPEIFLTAAEEIYGRNRLAGLRRPVAIHVTSKQFPNKSWLMDGWRALVAARPDLQFVQIGLAGEERVEGAIDARGATVRQAFAIIKACAAYVGVESGFAHAATALGTPAVVLFGPTTPVVWGHPANVNVFHRQPCAPCIDLLRAAPCPYGAPCMTQISVDETLAALDAQLGARGPRDARDVHGAERRS